MAAHVRALAAKKPKVRPIHTSFLQTLPCGLKTMEDVVTSPDSLED